MGTYYHVTNKFLGKQALFKPKRRSDEDSFFPRRVCVAPTIGQCLVALPPHKLKRVMYIYQIKGVPHAKSTEFDVLATREKWFLGPVEGVFKCRIHPSWEYLEPIYNCSSIMLNCKPRKIGILYLRGLARAINNLVSKEPKTRKYDFVSISPDFNPADFA